MPPASSSSRCEIIFAKQCILATLNSLIGTGKTSTNLNSSASTALVDILAMETLHASAFLSSAARRKCPKPQAVQRLGVQVLDKGKDLWDPMISRFRRHPFDP